MRNNKVLLIAAFLAIMSLGFAVITISIASHNNKQRQQDRRDVAIELCEKGNDFRTDFKEFGLQVVNAKRANAQMIRGVIDASLSFFTPSSPEEVEQARQFREALNRPVQNYDLLVDELENFINSIELVDCVEVVDG